ncbi:MAG: hypothetical protein J5938_06105 [Clostridia bacterium]|nr:hypothetical protein [Clostridia bacterium]
MVKRIASLLLIFFTALALLASCAPSDAPGGESGALTEEEFFKLIEESEKYGQKFDNLLMDETAAYFYGFSGASVSAMRLAVERLLWLKGEGDDFDSLTAGSRYTDWDEIAEICYASPYPYYFEGLIFDVQGKSEEAAKAYASAAVMGNYPEKGLSFRYLAGKSTADLYALRDKLRGYEEEIYGLYRPVLHGYGRSPYNFSAEYLCADAMELLDAGKYAEAMVPACYALRIRPTEPECWICAITAAAYADEAYKATKWLEEALRYHPDHEGLNALASSFVDISSRNGGEEG